MVNKLDWTIFVLDKNSSYNLINLSKILENYKEFTILSIVQSAAFAVNPGLFIIFLASVVITQAFF